MCNWPLTSQSVSQSQYQLMVNASSCICDIVLPLQGFIDSGAEIMIDNDLERQLLWSQTFGPNHDCSYLG